MAIYKGDYPTSHTAVTLPFDSFAAATGAPSAVTNFANTDVQIYKDGGTTQRSSASGITVTTSFDTQTGEQMVVIDLSDNTDAGFYAAGHEYDVFIQDITVDGQTLRFYLGAFSIERAGGILATLKAMVAAVGTAALIRTAVGLATANLDTQLSGLQSDTDNIQTRIPAALTANGNMKSSVLEFIATSLTETSGQIAAAFKQFFDVASPTGTMKAITLVSTLTTYTGNTPQTGDSFARLGAPAGASVSADIAAIRTDTNTTIPNLIAALNNISSATVKAQVVAALATDTYAEPAQGTPAATTTLAVKIGFLYKAWRNRTTMTASQYSLYNDDATTVDHKASFSDDATTADKGEVATGP